MGSPLYMSPEQMEASRDVDPRSDIWSLGVVLYESVSRKVPFSADNLPQLCKKLEKEDPTPLSHYRPDVPPEFQAVIDRCLAKKRTDRYPNVGAFASALAALAPRSAQVSVGRITRVLANAGTLQDLTDSLAATDRANPPATSHVSIDIPENSARVGPETRPGSPQAMAAETAEGLKTMSSGAPSSIGAEVAPSPPVQNVATAAPWSNTASPTSARTKLGIRIGAVVAAVAGIVIYISTGRPSGNEGAASSAPAANVEPTEPAAEPAPAPTAEAPAATAPSSAPALAASATPPALSAVVPVAAGAKPAKALPSALPRPVTKPTAPVSAKPQQSAKPEATPARPAGLFDDRR
jgi:serine/threonine-protein kinase